MSSHDGAAGLQGGSHSCEFVGRASDVHAGVMEDDIADVDEVAVEDQGAGRLGHVAAGLPPCPKAGGCQLGVELHDSDGKLLELTSERPRQIWKRIGSRSQSLRPTSPRSPPQIMHSLLQAKLL